jgi:hypothetical protein
MSLGSVSLNFIKIKLVSTSTSILSLQRLESLDSFFHRKNGMKTNSVTFKLFPMKFKLEGNRIQSS